MDKNTNNFRELENRTTDFAKRVIRLCKELSKNTINTRLIDQIVRSAGSVGANYREANEALGKEVEYVGFAHKPSFGMQKHVTLSKLLLKDEISPFIFIQSMKNE